MSDNRTVHSTAFNFLSAVRGGVDPRTGLYTVSIELPDLKSHALAGPALKLALHYNPLNTQDSGYGKGWNLGLTQYTRHNQVLALGTGESFRLEESSREDKRLNIPQQKIASFHVYKEGNLGLDETTRFRVVHRSGLKEILQMQDDNLALPVSVLHMGRKLKLEHLAFNSQYFRLQAIFEVTAQGDENALLTVERSSSTVEIKEHSLANGGVARYVMSLGGNDDRVTQIALPTANKANWQFEYEYDASNSYLSIVGVRTPTGAREVLEYTDGGHEFPSAARRNRLPRVNRHKTTPGKPLPQLGIKHALVDVGFVYENAEAQGWGNNNFLGDRDTPWVEDSGLDNLYYRQGVYQYGSVETHYVNDTPVKTIERRFNRFHLLETEKTLQGRSLREQIYKYPVDQEKTFELQPANFQLVTEQTQRWTLLESGRPPRSPTEYSRYDVHGNLVWRKRFNEVEELHEWYPVGGDGAACPPDPEGFVRHLKQTTITPAATGFGQAPTLTTHYTYISLPAVIDSEYDANDPDNQWRAYGQHVVEGQTLINAGEAIEGTYFCYFDQPDDALRLGRVREQEVNYPGVDPDEVWSTTSTYGYEEVFDKASGEFALQTIETISGFDQVSKTLETLRSVLHGEPLLNSDDNGVRIRYVYDALRRVTRETVDPDGEDEAFKHYEYHLCAHDEDVAEQAVTDVIGVRTRSIVDGFNRVVYEERDDDDSKLFAGAPRPIYRAWYDALGQLEARTDVDWYEDWQLELEYSLEYDDWGELYCEIGPEGIRDYSETDPVGSTEHKGPIVTRWRVDDQGVQSGVTQTWMNLFEKAVRVERYYLSEDDTGKPVKQQVSLLRQDYDGLGRLHRERDGEGDRMRINVYAYDAFDRQVTHTLPGNAVVTRAYAMHSREDLPVSIKVGDVLLGTQTFDGLGRRTHAITGFRDQEFQYRQGERQPCLMIAPDKAEVSYDYRPALGEEPVHRHLGAVDANYIYHRKNARLVEFDEPGYKVELEYFTNGEVKHEDRYVGDELYSMSYGYSYRSRMHRYGDVLNQEQVYEYDDCGRLKQTRLHAAPAKRRGRTQALGPVLLQTDFTYDSFGRMESFTTQDIQAGTELVTSLEYDGFDRETRRTFDFGGETVQTLTQRYDEFDCLEQRVLAECERESDEPPLQVLRDESYRYDTRGRLVNYTCDAFDNPQAPEDHYWPVDPYGKKIKTQVFSFDDLDNITVVLTTFDGGFNRALYSFGDYRLEQDPAQLLRITNTHADYPREILLEYDKNGNLTRDDAGRTLKYDALNRLVLVTLPGSSPAEPGESVAYRYDARNILSGTEPAA
ncbi:RHS repeat domain-containing protein [Pseudomonas vlassakiae]|uniref:YD repeat-containing protein n=1 Tax=Pseudomonas vlassakiae TaxID=485888 RepID=A0A923K601_9PSED|nr:hypothetical protein [Pseudomonas vlassakiae]MBV4539702.1 hypothetical protein [Pseudomonas vlassakiae]